MTPLEELSKLLSDGRITLSAAESCTGGLLGSMITSVPGASSYYLGGTVTYCDESKEKVLKVPSAVLAEYGAVSEETAVYMAEGVKELFGSDLSVSITGVAGPGGGSAGKPVGLVWIGISAKDGTFAKRFNFEGNREEVRRSSADAAVWLLISAVGQAIR